MGFFDSLLGKTGKKVAKETLEYNQGQAQTGYKNSTNYLAQGYDAAKARMSPYSETGRQAGTAYTNLLGLNGAGAQSGATAAYKKSNPYLAATMDMQTKALDRRAAATGQFGSGLNALAKARVVDETANRDYQDYMTKLQGLMAQGYTADQALAVLDSGYAANRVGVENAFRTANVGSQNQYAKDYTAADTAGVQNVIGLAGTLMNGAGMFMGGGGAKPVFSQPGTAANGGWSTTATPAPASNNFFNWLKG
jgi:hypothetical protein